MVFRADRYRPDQSHDHQASIPAPHFSELPAAHLVEAFPHIIWTADAAGKIEYRNRRFFEYTGCRAGDDLRHAEQHIIHQDDLERVIQSWSQAVRTGVGDQIEYRLRRADGVFRWHVCHSLPLRIEGKIVKWFGTSWEIEDLKQASATLSRHEALLRDLLERERAARAEAERANRSKDEFLATLSHELRTPLNAILGWAQLLRGNKLDAQRIAHGIEVVERNAMRQARLIEDILDLSRIIAGKLHMQMIEVDLKPIIESAADAVRPTAIANSIHLIVNLAGVLPFIVGDAHRMEQVMWNLLSNSVKFTPPGGRVEVEAEAIGDELTIKVSDTGQGIPPESLPHIFDRFWQADGSMTRSRGGLGLGLAIVAHLVELHGGTVEAESPGHGGGTCFTVHLPCKRVPDRRLLSTALDPAPASNGFEEEHPTRIDSLDRVHVLLVEDEEDTRELLRMALESRGARVRVAESVAEALDCCREEAPTVVVSDIGLPEEDGCELIRRLRSGAFARVPAVAISAHATEEDARRSLAAGFQYHLAKPIELDALVAVIAQLVV